MNLWQNLTSWAKPADSKSEATMATTNQPDIEQLKRAWTEMAAGLDAQQVACQARTWHEEMMRMGVKGVDEAKQGLNSKYVHKF
jgi:hypothetical protein